MLLCVTLPKLLFTLVSVAGRCAALWLPSAAHRADVAAAVLAAALALAFLYGFVFGWRRITVRHVEVVSPHLPEAFDGYRVAHISDLHVGTWGDDTAFLGRFVGRVNALHPDVILFTGDLVNMLASEVGPHMGVLSRLEARDGVFSVLGNHDYCEYGRYDTRDGALRQRDTLIAREGEMGWRLLRDGNVVLRRGGDCMALIGVENTGRPPFPARGDLGKALEGVPAEAFKILLSHDPSHWRSEVLPRDGHRPHPLGPHPCRAAARGWLLARPMGVSRVGRPSTARATARCMSRVGAGGTVPLPSGGVARDYDTDPAAAVIPAPRYAKSSLATPCRKAASVMWPWRPLSAAAAREVHYTLDEDHRVRRRAGQPQVDPCGARRTSGRRRGFRRRARPSRRRRRRRL